MKHPLDFTLNLAPNCLELSVRVKQGGVCRTKAKTLGDLVCWEPGVLCYWCGVGELGEKSIKAELAQWGLRLGMSREIALTREGWVFLGESQVAGIAEELKLVTMEAVAIVGEQMEERHRGCNRQQNERVGEGGCYRRVYALKIVHEWLCSSSRIFA